MSKKGLKIGLVDSMGFCLQERLMREGHSLSVLVPDSEKIEGNFNVTSFQKGKIKQVISVEELISEKCDYYIVMNEHDGNNTYGVLKQLGLPVIGYSPDAELLEKDRKFAKLVCEKIGLTKYVKMPNNKQFNSIPALKKFLKTSKKKWVFKKTAESPKDVDVNRTVVSFDHKQTLNLLNSTNAWFNKDGVGGVLLEEYVDGQEIAFAAWFDGEKFLMPYYSYTEYKGAQNYDRGFIQTGEVGTTIYWHHDYDEDNNITQMFRKLEPFLKGKCSGMVDLNCMLDKSSGDLTLLEFTMRFGRPTLELQLAAMPFGKTNVGEVFHKIAKGKHKEDIFFKAYANRYYTGVGVYHYGYPLITDEKTIRIPFEFPKIKDPWLKDKVSIQQSFSMWNDDYKALVTGNDRQFVVVGIGHTYKQSIDLAYEPLVNYKLLGNTWRDDVGSSFSNCIENAERHLKLRFK